MSSQGVGSRLGRNDSTEQVVTDYQLKFEQLKK